MFPRVRRSVQVMCRFGLPVVFAAMVMLPIYDQFHPWRPADAPVPPRPGQTRLLVGAGYRSHSAYSEEGGAATHTERTVQYVYYPEVLRSHVAYSLAQRDGGPISATIEPFSPVGTLIGAIVGIGLCAVAWVFPLPAQR
jgi:hypothetical protein